MDRWELEGIDNNLYIKFEQWLECLSRIIIDSRLSIKRSRSVPEAAAILRQKICTINKWKKKTWAVQTERLSMLGTTGCRGISGSSSGIFAVRRWSSNGKCYTYTYQRILKENSCQKKVLSKQLPLIWSIRTLQYISWATTSLSSQWQLMPALDISWQVRWTDKQTKGNRGRNTHLPPWSRFSLIWVNTTYLLENHIKFSERAWLNKIK